MKKKIESYYDKTKHFPSTGSLYKAIMISNKYEKRALDLGSGAFRDTRLLINSGFIVDAVDFNPDVRNFSKWSDYFPKEVFNLFIEDISDFDFKKNYYDIINAQNVFTFIPKDKTKQIFTKIKKSLKKNGSFTGNFIGEKDWSLKTDWKKKPIYYTKKEIDNLLGGFEILNINESKGKQLDLDGITRYMHVFEFIACKP